jgi:hypothetical protein
MHSPQMRLARALYQEWRLLPDTERGRIAPLAREVKELALDLRGATDRAGAESELRLANQALATVLDRAALSRAA